MQPNRRELLTGQGFVRAMQDAAARTDDSWIAAPPTAGPNVRLETRAMACAWSVLLNPGPAPELAVASEALELVHRLEDQLTIFRDHSVISQINRQPPEVVLTSFVRCGIVATRA